MDIYEEFFVERQSEAARDDGFWSVVQKYSSKEQAFDLFCRVPDQNDKVRIRRVVYLTETITQK